MKRTTLYWLICGLVSYILLPWHMTENDFFDFAWISDDQPSTGLFQIIGGHWWLLPAGLALALSLICQLIITQPVIRAKATLWISSIGLVFTALQGLIIVRDGPRVLNSFLDGALISSGQAGMGVGAGLCILALLFAVTTSISQSGKGQGDAFVVGAIGLIVALVGVFVFFPVMHILIQAFQVENGYAIGEFASRFFSSDIWGLSCLISGRSCGVGINSLFLAIMTGLGTTLLGLSFALIFTRTDFRAKKLLRVLTVIPIITPPFVIGLALILLFGRAGTVTEFFAELFGLEATRWVYGFWGVYFAQLLSFTPIAFLVLIGVVQGVSPSMEEASQTLDADRWQPALG